ncbi:MAG: hypothetical protein OEX12_05870 [Gammaproteobacteria bacterium]|nr:hypothetical protein [Gammaproteobacteria bacterium]
MDFHKEMGRVLNAYRAGEGMKPLNLNEIIMGGDMSDTDDLREIWIKNYIDSCWESEGDFNEAFCETNAPAFMKMVSVAMKTQRKSDYALVGKTLILRMGEYFKDCAEKNTGEPSIEDTLIDTRGLE